jgi:putative phage-type endonuclease
MTGPLNNSPEWYEQRAKLITSSNFKRILPDVGPKGFGPGAEKYALEIASFMLTGIPPKGDINTEEVAWGNEHEAEARHAYELHTFNVVEPGRLVQKKDCMIGASPDGFVGTDGLIEIKCPSSAIHLWTITNRQMPLGHLPQVQGQLWVTGRDWVDFVSYDPRFKDPSLRLFVQRIPRNESFIMELSTKVLRFQDLVLSYAKRGTEASNG